MNITIKIKKYITAFCKVIFVIQPDTMRIRASVAEKLDAGRECQATIGHLYLLDN